MTHSEAIDKFLNAIQTAAIPACDVWSADATLDAGHRLAPRFGLGRGLGRFDPHARGRRRGRSLRRFASRARRRR